MRVALNRICIFAAINFFGAVVHAQNPFTTGVTLLRAATTNLDGSGVRVAQVEATVDTNGDYFEVNPVAVGVATNLFYYVSDLGTATNFPNSIGYESGHADGVAQDFYGPAGVATNVAHVDNWFADDFAQVNTFPLFSVTLPSTNIADAVVNQSYTFGSLSVSDQETIDSAFDNYAAQYGTLFVSAADNASISARVSAPGTAYNCISVGAYHGDSSVGPTIDDGRCKPDITAPAPETSFSTPQVAGAAAVLIQAALRGDGGSDTNSAADLRMVKALLLNGAVKPADWTNSESSPLDFRYGAGVANVFNSYEQLAGGKQENFVSDSVSAGAAHPPIAATNFISALSAWDFNSCVSFNHPATDAVNHYFFNVTNALANSGFSATATLVWNRQQGQTAINDLNLFLYNCANSNLVMCSTSLVDNVEHIFVPRLPQGRYDLQVWKAGGSGIVSTAENYALAWNFSSEILSATKSGTNLNLSWPIYPAGFAVAATTNLTSPVWRTNNFPTPAFTNGQNVISIPATNAVEFFRLQTPNF